MDAQVSVESMKLLKRWNKALKQFFQQLKTMSVQTAVSWKVSFYIPNTVRVSKLSGWKKFSKLLPAKQAAVLFW